MDPDVDCKCYIRILSVENIPTEQSGWSIEIDPLHPFINEFNGVLQNWLLSPGILLPLPSSYRELTPPSNGFHSFSMASYEGFLAAEGFDFTINTEVKCYLQQPDGTEFSSTRTYHSFVWNEGEVEPGTNFRVFRKEFSCVYLTNEDPIIREN